jgi:hypothetical protein
VGLPAKFFAHARSGEGHPPLSVALALYGRMHDRAADAALVAVHREHDAVPVA